MTNAARITKSYTETPAGQLHCRGVYRDAPGRTPIVCLHQSPKSGRDYHELMPWLATERAVIAPDYPGHGESYLPPVSPAITLEEFAAAAWQVIDDRLGAGPVHLVGHHTGSMVAIEAARQQPDRVIGIVNIAAPVFTDEELAAFIDYFQPIPLDEAGNRFRIMWERVMQHRGPGMTLTMAATSMAENLRAGDLYECGHDAAFAYAKRYVENFAKTPQPILVMNPNDDTYEATQRIDPFLKNGQRKDYPDWGTGLMFVHPQAVAAEILAFLTAVEDAA